MSTIIKFDLQELRDLANDKNSCILEKKVTQNLALQPWCLGNLTDSIKNLLDYKIGKFDKEFDGILLSYKNLRVLQNVGAIHNDNADIHFQVQADYFIFRPYVGATLKGIVNKKFTTHLSILIHRVFNVVIPRPADEPGYNWIGNSINEGQEVLFQIVVLDLYGALPYIRGKLDERWVKLFLDEEDEEIESKSSKSINVSLINFDKTKANHKQDEDKKLNSSTKKKSRMSNISKECNEQINDDTLNHIGEKIKTKRHKVLEMDIKQSTSKKVKKNG